MPQLDQKATTVFAGKVVRKDLVRKVKVGANVPVFVLEYLLGKYCATDDPAAIAIRFATPATWTDIRAGLDPTARTFADAAGFEPRAGRHLLLPTCDGGLAAYR